MAIKLSDDLKKAMLEAIPGFIVTKDGVNKVQFDAVEFSLTNGNAKIELLCRGIRIGEINMLHFPGQSVTLSGIEGLVTLTGG